MAKRGAAVRGGSSTRLPVAITVTGVLVALVLASTTLGVVTGPRFAGALSRSDLAAVHALERGVSATGTLLRAIGTAGLGSPASLSRLGLHLASTHVYAGEYLSGNSQAGGDFGYSIAVSGTTMVVGAPGENVSGFYEAGNAYVFDLKTGALVRTLTSPAPGLEGYFGFSVAISGKTVAIAAPGESVGSLVQAGHVYLFNAKSGALLSTYTSPAPQSGGFFGYSIAAFGKLVVVGAPGENASGVGYAGNTYVFSGHSSTPLATLQSPNPDFQGYFGFYVALSKTLVVVGAPTENASGVEQGGHVYTFSTKTHALASTLTSPNLETDGNFGESVAVSGNTLVVGASGETAGGDVAAGHAYVFNAKTAVLSFTFQSASPQAQGNFGARVAVGGSLIVIGAPDEAANGVLEAGNVYAFVTSTGVPAGSYTSPNPAMFGAFGYSLAVGKSSLAVGAPGESAFNETVAGQVYVY